MGDLMSCGQVYIVLFQYPPPHPPAYAISLNLNYGLIKRWSIVCAFYVCGYMCTHPIADHLPVKLYLLGDYKHTLTRTLTHTHTHTHTRSHAHATVAPPV